MSIMTRRRPGSSAWAELAEAGMDKEAGPKWDAVKGGVKALGGWIDSKTMPLVNSIGNRGGIGPAAMKLPGKYVGAVKANPLRTLGLTAAVPGVPLAAGVGAQIGGEHPHTLSLGLGGDLAASDQAVAQAQQRLVDARAAQPPPPPKVEGPGMLDQARDFAVNNWKPLAAGGTILGAGGLWLKHRADKKREEEEEELMGGLNPKSAMLKLAAEFPVQVGFLARCGERKLSGREVRAAVEKCAAISDGMADEWTRFFVAAAGPEAGAPSRMVKAAVGEGFDATAVKPAPVKPVQPPALPGGGGLNRVVDRMTGGLPDGPPTVQPPTARPPAPKLVQAPTPEADPNPIAHELAGVTWGGKPPMVPKSQLDAAGIGTATGPVRPPGYRPTAPRPAAPGPALTNQQQAMAQAAPDDVIAQRREYARKLQLAEKSNNPAEAARLRAQGVPQGAPAGPAGANRPALDPVALGRRNQLARQGQRDADDAEEGIAGEQAAFWNSMGRNQWIPERQDVQDAQAQKARMVNRGMDPAMAEGADWTRPDNDPTVGSYTGRFARRVPSAIAALPTTALNAVHDTSRGVGGMLRGRGADGFDYTNTQDAARDLAAPFTEGLGGATTQGPQIHDTFYQDTTADAADKLHEYAGGTEGNMLARGLASVAETPTRYSGDILGTAMTAGTAGVLPQVARGAAGMMGFGGGLWGAGLGTAGMGLLHGGPQLSGQAQQDFKAEQLAKATAGDPAAYEKAYPMPANPDDAGGWAQGFYEAQRNGENARRAKDGYGLMNEQEELAFKERTIAPVAAKVEQMHDQRVARTIPGMADAQGNYNPNGQVDISGIDGNNVQGWLDAQPGRAQAVARVQEKSTAQFNTLAQKLPEEMTHRLAMGGEPTPQDLEAIKAAGVDPKALQQSGKQLAATTAITMAQQNGGSVKDAMATLNDPATIARTAQTNPSVSDAAQKQVQAGEAPDFMSAVSKIWGDMGPMGQMLAVGGLALGAIGLFSALSGEGGIGSILMTLLGGAGLGVAANKAGLLPEGVSDMINPILEQFGLASPTAPAAPAVGGTTPADQAAAAARAGAPVANPGAAGKVGVKMDPAAMNALMQAPPAQQDAKLQETLKADPTVGPGLAGAAKHWGTWRQGFAMGKMKERIKGITPQQADALVAAYRRLPPAQQAQYLAQYNAGP